MRSGAPSFHQTGPRSPRARLALSAAACAAFSSHGSAARFADATALRAAIPSLTQLINTRKQAFRLHDAISEAFQGLNRRSTLGPEGRLRRIFATILVERDMHKAMIIGQKGAKLKQISTEARLDMEKLFDGPVYLETFVKVRSGWADNEAGLRAYGYE